MVFVSFGPKSVGTTMASFLRIALFLAGCVSAVPSPQSLKSSLTILIENDLQGKYPRREAKWPRRLTLGDRKQQRD